MKNYLNHLPLLLALGGYNTLASAADCIDAAANCFQINPLLIKAIIWNESGFRQQAVNINNNNKTQDVGLMQINSIHFPHLRQLGISEQKLRSSSCANVMSGTYILSREIEQAGYSWSSIGRYHSRTPAFRERYASKLIETIKYKHRHLNKSVIDEEDSQEWLALFRGYCKIPT